MASSSFKTAFYDLNNPVLLLRRHFDITGQAHAPLKNIHGHIGRISVWNCFGAINTVRSFCPIAACPGNKSIHSI